MFNFLRRKPQDPRMKNPLWGFYYEEFRRAGKPFNSEDIFGKIIDNFVVYDKGEKAEIRCRDGFYQYGRGALVNTPLFSEGHSWSTNAEATHRYHHMYVSKTMISELMPFLAPHIVQPLVEVMESYNPYKEYISAVSLVFGNDYSHERTTMGELDLFGWIALPYFTYEPPKPPPGDWVSL